MAPAGEEPLIAEKGPEETGMEGPSPGCPISQHWAGPGLEMASWVLSPPTGGEQKALSLGTDC